MDDLPLIVNADANVAIDLFRGDDWNATRLMKILHGGNITLVITELALVQCLSRNLDPAFRRFRRIAEFSKAAGLGWFRMGAPLREMMKGELTFPDPAGPRMIDAYPDEMHLQTMSLAESLSDFQQWHANLIVERDSYIGPKELARDRRARELAIKELEAGLGKKAGDEAWLRKVLEEIPRQLDTNPFLASLVEDEGQRARVLAEPHRCPTIVSLALGFTLNAFGSAANPHDIDGLRDLQIGADSWADVRVMAESARGDVFATGDQDLAARTNRIKAWGYYKPRIATWEEIVAERCR